MISSSSISSSSWFRTTISAMNNSCIRRSNSCAWASSKDRCLLSNHRWRFGLTIGLWHFSSTGSKFHCEHTSHWTTIINSGNKLKGEVAAPLNQRGPVCLHSWPRARPFCSPIYDVRARPFCWPSYDVRARPFCWPVTWHRSCVLAQIHIGTRSN